MINEAMMFPAVKRGWLILLLSVLLMSCQTLSRYELDNDYGKASPVERFTLTADSNLYQQAHQVLESRCVVCHACYDAPCQLKLSSMEGLDRGASSERVYDGTRLIAKAPSRLFDDGNSTSDWREKNFYPVLNERGQNFEDNLNLSVLYRLLKLKQDNPLPDTQVLPEDYDLRLRRDQFCPKIENIHTFEEEHPLWGMPYALPALNHQEFKTLEQWIAHGAQAPQRAPLPTLLQEKVEFWEAFFNGTSLKQKLVNRYFYEHLYLAHFYFDEVDEQTFFRMVRSATPPGEPIQVIPTRRVYDDPAQPFYYRLQQVRSTIVAKTHMPYVLNKKRYQRWQQLFYKPDYQVQTLPDYDRQKSSNPFRVFKDIPMVSRYKFLLDEAQYSIMNFIKGPVCRGQIALDVINDHFWVAFLNPDIPDLEKTGEFLKQNTEFLRFPAYWESNSSRPWKWYELEERQRKFLNRRADFVNRYAGKTLPLDMNLIWDGSTDQGFNDNAMLTIFRHFDSATVIKGAAGHYPKTAWVIDYPLLERIHYLLVAGFDVNGNLVHQLLTRLYMDFLRMEGEANFLTLLPLQERTAVQHAWYQGVDGEVDDFFNSALQLMQTDTAIQYQTDQPVHELMQMLVDRTQAYRYELHQDMLVSPALERLNSLRSKSISYLPQTAVLRVDSGQQQHWFSLIHHNEHLNITQMLNEEAARIPENDNLTVMEGIVSAYPNAFYRVSVEEVSAFAKAVSELQSEQDYQMLMERFGVRRTDPSFWQYSDDLHAYYRQQAGVWYGVLDYNRMENR